MGDKEEVLASIAAAVRDGSEDDAVSLCRKGLSEGISPLVIIRDGLSRGMHDAGELFAMHQYFLPELLIASEAMQAGIGELVPSLQLPDEAANRGTVILGVVEGDVHEIGKNLVGVILEAEGFKVVDLGFDVAPQRFLDEVKASGARILALSTMMTTTLPNMRKTVELALGLEPRPVIIVGGAPLSSAVAADMGADGYEDNATRVPTLIQGLLA